MPLYEFLCSDCEHESEHLIRGDDKPRCPKCGGKKMSRLLSACAAPAGQSGGKPSPAELGCSLPQCGGGRCAMGG